MCRPGGPGPARLPRGLLDPNGPEAERYIADALKGQRDGHMLPWAVRDLASGTIVGSKSYGKGSIQGIFPLDSAGVGMRAWMPRASSHSGSAATGEA